MLVDSSLIVAGGKYFYFWVSILNVFWLNIPINYWCLQHLSMSLILLHAGGCRALAPLAHRKVCNNIVADLVTVASCSSTGSCALEWLLSHWGVCGPGRMWAPLRRVPAGIPPHPARLQHLAAGYSFSGYCSASWEKNGTWAVFKKTGLELLALHFSVPESWCRSDCPHFPVSLLLVFVGSYPESLVKGLFLHCS